MKSIKYSHRVVTFCIVTLLLISVSHAQSKKLKRPKNTIGVSSVDSSVKESFDIYEKVYKYHGYAKAGTPLEDEDFDVLKSIIK